MMHYADGWMNGSMGEGIWIRTVVVVLLVILLIVVINNKPKK